MINMGVNQLLKLTASLKQRKNREKTGLFVIEGERFINEIPANWDIAAYIISENYAKHNIIEQLDKSKSYIVTDDKFKKISDTVTPTGLLAVCRQKEYDLGDILLPKQNFLLICDCIQDPGNLGTLIRTSHACGCNGIILSEGCVDVYNPKVLRASAGSAFRVPFLESVNLVETIPFLKQNKIKIIGTHLNTDNLIYSVDLSVDCAVIVGNEGQGISDSVSKMADFLVKIPMPGKAESLNASVATGVILFEVVRQRYFS